MNKPAAQEAEEINALLPDPFYAGKFYPITYKGKEIRAARVYGVGRNAGKQYLHIIKPLVISVGCGQWKTTGSIKYKIELYNPNAAWKDAGITSTYTPPTLPIPDDPRIFNRPQADGTYRPLSEFFDNHS